MATVKKAYKTKWFDPYTDGAKRKTNIPGLRLTAQAGVYFIRSKRTNNIVYIGYSASSLYKTIYRHFQKWNDPQQERNTYNPKNYEVRVIFTRPALAAKIEKVLIQRIQPRDNGQKYQSIIKESQEAAEALRNLTFLQPGEECPF